MRKQAQIRLLAINFSRLLRQSLKPEQMDIINSMNSHSKDTTCATHDYLDANVVMDNAFKMTFSREPNIQLETNGGDLRLWNDAWTFAKISEFAPYDTVIAYDMLSTIVLKVEKFEDYNQPIADATEFVSQNINRYHFKS